MGGLKESLGVLHASERGSYLRIQLLSIIWKRHKVDRYCVNAQRDGQKNEELSEKDLEF